MSALNLEMPGRVPRTEYSADMHLKLIKAVTGIEVSEHSPEDLRKRASSEFRKAWNYDFVWNILIYNDVFGDKRTRIGHAEYTDL